MFQKVSTFSLLGKSPSMHYISDTPLKYETDLFIIVKTEGVYHLGVNPMTHLNKNIIYLFI